VLETCVHIIQFRFCVHIVGGPKLCSSDANAAVEFHFVQLIGELSCIHRQSTIEQGQTGAAISEVASIFLLSVFGHWAALFLLAAQWQVVGAFIDSSASGLLANFR
jgi:hypothetical protein